MNGESLIGLADNGTAVTVYILNCGLRQTSARVDPLLEPALGSPAPLLEFEIEADANPSFGNPRFVGDRMVLFEYKRKEIATLARIEHAIRGLDGTDLTEAMFTDETGRIILHIAGGGGSYLPPAGEKPADPTNPKEKAAQPVHVNEPQEPAAQIDVTGAIELYSLYNTNEVQADRRYRNQRIEVYGIAEKVGKDSSGDAYLSFYGDENLGWVHCYFSSRYDLALASVMPKSIYRVRGTCRGKTLFAVNLVDCDFVSVKEMAQREPHRTRKERRHRSG